MKQILITTQNDYSLLNKRLEEFFSSIQFNESNWCWEWTRSLSAGYGYFRLYDKKISVHRISYQLFKGQIPNDKELDHLCRNTKCCNPEHLEPISHKENVLRGNGPTAINSQKTHCDNGHEYTLENTFIRKNGNRDCRMCMKISKRKSYNKHKDKRNAETLQHYHENRETIKSRRRELYRTNHSEERKKKNAYVQSNRDHVRQYAKEWRLKNKEKFNSYQKKYRELQKEKQWAGDLIHAERCTVS